MIDYYQILNLHPDWDIDKLRKSIRETYSQTKVRVNAATDEKLKEIEQLLKLIVAAKKILTDPDAKAKYDQELLEWKKNATPEQKAAAAGILNLEQIWELIDAGRYKDAAKAAKRLTDEYPQDDKAWEVYAYASFRASDIGTAIDAAQQAINCNPKAEYYADAGQYLAAAERWNEASAKLSQAIEKEPDCVGYKLTLTDIYMKQQAWSDAEAILEGILSQDRNNQTACSCMAIVIGAKAEAKFPEYDALIEENKKRQARKLLKEIQQLFEQADKYAEKDPELREMLNSESFLVRRVMGVNFYRRILGLIIDIILVLPAILLMSIDGGNNPVASFFGFILMLGIIGYSWVWLAYKNSGQDLTKRLLGMQIVSDSDSLPNVGQLTGRAVAKPIAIALGGLFPVLALSFTLFSGLAQTDGEPASFIGLMIGFVIGVYIAFFRLCFDLFFVTSKDLLPNFFGLFLFLHEHLTKTTVINSTRDDSMNFTEYNWY